MDEFVTLDSDSASDIFPNFNLDLSLRFLDTWYQKLFYKKRNAYVLSKIVMVDFVNHSYDYRPNWTPHGPINIINSWVGNYSINTYAFFTTVP